MRNVRARYFENGYISQAIPTPIMTNSANDHSACLTRSAAVRCVRHASARDTSAAKVSSAGKWLNRKAANAANQCLLMPPAARNFVCIESGQKVHNARRGDEPRAVIACRA